MSIQDTLARVRNQYGASPTKDECGAICNDTAYIHRNDPEKWGVNRKDGGSHAVRYDGVNIAADIIQNGVTGEAFDCLVAAGDGGPATPAWNSVGVITDPARPWVAPIVPQTNPPDPPDPPDPPTPGDCPCKVQLAEIDRKLNDIAAILVALGQAQSEGNAQLLAVGKVGRPFSFRVFGISGQGAVNPVP